MSGDRRECRRTALHRRAASELGDSSQQPRRDFFASSRHAVRLGLGDSLLDRRLDRRSRAFVLDGDRHCDECAAELERELMTQQLGSFGGRAQVDRRAVA